VQEGDLLVGDTVFRHEIVKCRPPNGFDGEPEIQPAGEQPAAAYLVRAVRIHRQSCVLTVENHVPVVARSGTLEAPDRSVDPHATYRKIYSRGDVHVRTCTSS